MTWFRVDDTFCGHSKPRRAGLAAVGLWVLAGSWCGQQRSDGHVPTWYVESWPNGRHLASRLVQSGLWHASGHACDDCPQPVDGWVFHDYHQCNPSRAEELNKQVKRAAAGRLGGLKSARTRSKTEANASANASANAQAGAPANAGQANEPRPSTTSTYVPAPPDLDPLGRSTTYVPASGKETHARAHGAPAGQPGRIELLLQEHVREVGKVNPRAMTELGSHLAELCQAGYTDKEIRAGFVLWRARSVRPSSLPDQVDYARRNGAHSPLSPDRDGRRSTRGNPYLDDLRDAASVTPIRPAVET